MWTFSRTAYVRRGRVLRLRHLTCQPAQHHFSLQAARERQRGFFRKGALPGHLAPASAFAYTVSLLVAAWAAGAHSDALRASRRRLRK